MTTLPPLPVPPREFETERLRARPIGPADAEEGFAAYASDPEVTRYLTWLPHVSVDSLRAFYATRAEEWAKGVDASEWAWALRERASGQLVGTIGCGRRAHANDLCFGYALGRDWWGQGLMTEALAHLLAWARLQPSVYRAWAFCDPANPASARVMEKAGMVYEGRLNRWLAVPAHGPEPRDCLVYAWARPGP